MVEQDWSLCACPNPACSAYGQRGAARSGPHGWSSKSLGVRCLRCSVCGTDFSARRKGRVVKVEPRVVLGTEDQVAEVLSHRNTSHAVNTSYVERWNGTQRHLNARPRPNLRLMPQTKARIHADSSAPE